MPDLPLRTLREILRDRPHDLVGRVPGLHLVDKPAGLTSHDVVDIARKRLGLRRVGHGGTLDPAATGLLVLLCGTATRLFDDLQGFAKTYKATVRLGVRTDTGDLAGRELERRPVPDLSDQEIEASLDRFRGAIDQTPPMHSALKQSGRPLYKLARQGRQIERSARRVTVHALAWRRAGAHTLGLSLTVSRGFYVRSLAEDLGAALGCGGVLAALRRTEVGPFRVTEAVAPEALHPGPPPRA